MCGFCLGVIGFNNHHLCGGFFVVFLLFRSLVGMLLFLLLGGIFVVLCGFLVLFSTHFYPSLVIRVFFNHMSYNHVLSISLNK